MRLVLWILTISFVLGGLSLRADGGFIGALLVAKGCFLLALLACPFLWSGESAFIWAPLRVPGKQRLMMGLTLILAAPLILPWTYWL